MNTHDPAHAATPEWQARFSALVQANLQTPFAWGTHDCCLWAAAAVHAVSGQDLAATWRGTYSTAIEAARLLESLGGLAAVGALAGSACPPLLAANGDVGLLEHEGRQHLGVCVGPVWLVVAAKGLAALPLEAATQAWKVPHG